MVFFVPKVESEQENFENELEILGKVSRDTTYDLDEEHNRKVREERESRRPVFTNASQKMEIWKVWTYHAKSIEMQENARQGRDMTSRMVTGFEEKKIKSIKNNMGGTMGNEED